MGVEFNEESSLGGVGGQNFDSYRQGQTSSKMADMIIKFGFAKNGKQANYVLIGIMVLAFSITFYIIFSGNKSSVPKPANLGLPGPTQSQVQ